MRVITDSEIRRDLTAGDAVRYMRDALLAHADGRLTAPPRVHADLGDGRMVFTTGRLDGAWYGYRSYDTLGREPGAQLVAVHDDASGELLGAAVGNELGPRRVGAIGAVAADELARADASTIGLIGTGTQAWTQLWAIRAIRDIERVRVFSRTPSSREQFVARARRELRLDVEPVDSAEMAVTDAAIVILATNSPTPVIDAAGISPGAYVTTLGPKQHGRAEFGPDLVDRADVCATDSLAQITAYDPPNILAGTPQADRLVGLGEIVAGRHPGRTDDEQITLFCSVGLAGTEVYLLAQLLA